MTRPDTSAGPKQEMRERMRRARAGLSAGERVRAAGALAARGVEALRDRRGAIVAGYAPMPGEIDVLPLMERLEERGHALCLPVVEGEGLPLVFRRWRPGDALEAGRMGVRAPAAASAQVMPQIVLVPLLAFDRRGYRLGLGAGFYDRTLEALRATEPVLAIGVAFDEQEVETVPREAHDQRLDAIVTPSALIDIEP